MKKTIISFYYVFITVSMFNCRTDSDNEKIANASKNVGQSAAKVISGLKSGIEKVTKITVETSDVLKTKGISTGKTTLGSEGGGRHNKLSVYMIFDKNVTKNVTMKVYDSQNEEVGRTKMLIKGRAGDAKYIDFIFDKHTNIDRENKVVLE